MRIAYLLEVKFAKEAFQNFMQKSFISGSSDKSASQVVADLTVCVSMVQWKEEVLIFNCPTRRSHALCGPPAVNVTSECAHSRCWRSSQNHNRRSAQFMRSMIGIFSSQFSRFHFPISKRSSHFHRINQPPPFPAAPACRDTGASAAPALPPEDLAWLSPAPISPASFP